jgi:hypothetical protein
MDASMVDKSIKTFSESEKSFYRLDLTKDSLTEDFSKGEIVFKILSISPENGSLIDDKMVNTREDYEKKIYTHSYQPFLFTIDLGLRLAYLYGCLNLKFKNSQNKEYIFMWRKIRTNEWNKWFKINTYKDNLYKESFVIEYFL